jgi:hypothetical protein
MRFNWRIEYHLVMISSGRLFAQSCELPPRWHRGVWSWCVPLSLQQQRPMVSLWTKLLAFQNSTTAAKCKSLDQLWVFKTLQQRPKVRLWTKLSAVQDSTTAAKCKSLDQLWVFKTRQQRPKVRLSVKLWAIQNSTTAAKGTSLDQVVGYPRLDNSGQRYVFGPSCGLSKPRQQRPMVCLWVKLWAIENSTTRAKGKSWAKLWAIQNSTTAAKGSRWTKVWAIQNSKNSWIKLVKRCNLQVEYNFLIRTSN